MDKLIFPNGGIRLHGDDFRFQDNAIREAFKGLLKGFQTTGSVIVLQGCGVTYAGSSATVSEGYVFFEDEISYLPAQTVNLNSGNSVVQMVNLVPDVFNDVAGSEELQNGSTANTYQKRRVKCVVGITNTSTDQSKWVHIGAAINNVLSDNASTYLVLNGEMTNFINSAGSFMVRRTAGMIAIRGTIQPITGQQDYETTPVVQLPEAYWPTSEVLIPAYIQRSTSPLREIERVKIDTSGRVFVTGDNADEFLVRVTFNGVYW
jgi:hypothetical protein